MPRTAPRSLVHLALRLPAWFVDDVLLHPRHRVHVLTLMAAAVAVLTLAALWAPDSAPSTPAVRAVTMQSARAILAPPADPTEPADREAYLLGRVWLDRQPQSEREPFEIYFFGSHRVGVCLKAESVFRYTIEYFLYDVRGHTVRFDFPHARQQAQTTYTIQDFKGPGKNNLRLTLANDPRAGGKPRHFFGRLQGPSTLAPWVEKTVRAAAVAFPGK
ncbi:MAG: hypothetical protein HY814_11360 [Candidatus Riflebacteria bacterium]|nr:hypothetical protein [Candidatus Riflebacteria bacterium]